ncbi:MAG: branched-chain-amino-acid transaminase [Planctomycetota bacterium]
MKVWMDGEVRDAAEATVSVFDHGLLYGDGVFEGIRVYSGRIFRAAAHVDRLFEGARAIRLPVPIGKDDLIAAMNETLRANKLTDGYIRLIVTRGAGTLGLNPFKCSKPRVIIIADTIALYDEDVYEKGMSVIISSVPRNSTNALDPRVKSLNYLNNILARMEAVDAGVSEAIMLNAAGMVAEATGDNVFIVRDGVLITPPPHAGILAGITRGVVLDLAGQVDIPVAQRDLTRYDLYTADECFLTGTAAEIVPVTAINARTIGDGVVGPVTRRLKDAFHALVRSEQRD